MQKEINNRVLEYDCNEIFPKRWSPRSMSEENISKEELMVLFEAAKWAPSTYNNQPWRFLYAFKDTENWDLFFDLLMDGNKTWCKNAGVLIVVISKKIADYNKKPDFTHSLCTGSAWSNLALQGSMNGLVVHGMAGFNYDQAREKLNISDDYNVEMMITVGKPGKKEDLPEELQKMENPSPRKNLSEISIEGKFKEG